MCRNVTYHIFKVLLDLPKKENNRVIDPPKLFHWFTAEPSPGQHVFIYFSFLHTWFILFNGEMWTRERKDNNNNNNVTKLADRECLLHACSESKHCSRVFTLYFSWQLSTNNFCHLFHVQSRKSVKVNLPCLRPFLLWFSSPASSTCQAAFMLFFVGDTSSLIVWQYEHELLIDLCDAHWPFSQKTLKTSELFSDIVSIR